MPNRTIIITGASDGIGEAAARLLKTRGNSVVIIGRSPDKTKAVANKLGVPYYIADFTDLSQVRELATTLKKEYPRIDVLINNAGGIMAGRELTVDGHEKTMQVNHLAPFLLTNLLLDTLIKSNAVIINTSSSAAKIISRFDINDLEVEQNYSPNKAYGNAKLENILFTSELQRRYGPKGINTAAFHPGVIATSFADSSSSLMRILYFRPFRYFLLNAEQGADTLVWLATTKPGKVWTPGGFYTKRKIAKSDPKAYDQALAKELWDKSEALAGL